ncbi:hypothetical protein KA078_03860 [Candidatus Woesebacteria bacterium]|nr:hypothetical protein [Candidatus Woesebacteria bacterium]
MNTLVELGSLLREIGMQDEDVEAVIASAQDSINQQIEALRALLQNADPKDTTPFELCDCGESKHAHYVKFFGSPEAESELRSEIERKAVRKAEILMMFASMPGIILG